MKENIVFQIRNSKREIHVWLSATDEKISKWDHYYKEITQNGGQMHRDENLKVRFRGRNDSEKVSKTLKWRFRTRNWQNRSKVLLKEITAKNALELVADILKLRKQQD